MSIVYFRHETELNSELSWSRWILNSLIYSYSDKFISPVASKHAVWHPYFCNIPIGKHRAEKKRSVRIAASKIVLSIIKIVLSIMPHLKHDTP